MTMKVFETEICVNMHVLFIPCFCLQSLMHFPCENYGVCGNIEGGNIELFFTKRGEAEDLNCLSQEKKSNTNKLFFPVLCKYCFVPRYNYPLLFLVQMRLVASVIRSKSIASLDDSDVLLLCLYISYEFKIIQIVF